MDKLQLESGELHGFDFPADVRIPNEEETRLEILIDDSNLIERAEATVWGTLRAAWIAEIQHRLEGASRTGSKS